jgi:perosamine synthetase
MTGDDGKFAEAAAAPTAEATPRQVRFALPWFDESDIARVVESIRSGWVMQGPRVAEFESLFAKAVDAPAATAVSSCTAAMHLSLLALGVGPGDVVLTVSHSFIATANVVRMCGAEPVFLDIDPVSFNMSPSALACCLERDFEHRDGALWYGEVERLAWGGASPLARIAGPRGRLAALLVPHQAGMPADMVQIMAIAERLGIPVLEDAACALGSEIFVPKLGRVVPVGYPLGRAACFSMHPRKVISTGEGGMITSADPELTARARLLRQHGMDRSALERHGDATPTAESYPVLGYNYRLTDIQAALGIGQLRRLPQIVGRRRQIANRYRAGLGHLRRITLPKDPSFGKTNYQSYVVRVEDAGSARELMKNLQREGVATRFGIMCSHLEAPYAKQWIKGSLPESERARDESFILPLFPQMTDTDVDHVVRSTARLLA